MECFKGKPKEMINATVAAGKKTCDVASKAVKVVIIKVQGGKK